MRQRLPRWKTVRPLVQLLWALSGAGYWFAGGLTHTLAAPVFLVTGFVLVVEWAQLTCRWIRHGDAAFSSERS